ncbi:hypothetical protein [Limosilactobacillus gastricus]|nr:hypothetical protein [Limosilactobacillus gastricus]
MKSFGWGHGLLAIFGLLVLRLDKIILAVAKAYQLIKKAHHDYSS